MTTERTLDEILDWQEQMATRPRRARARSQQFHDVPPRPVAQRAIRGETMEVDGDAFPRGDRHA